MRQKVIVITIISLFALLFYSPILLNNSYLWGRHNDLNEFFGPIFLFVQRQILEYRVIPFWINTFLSGTPLLPDPQSPLFYLPNVLFLFFPIEQGFVISAILHSIVGGIGMYLLAKKALLNSRYLSLWMALLYISAPRLSGFIEAGHFGLIATWAWIPYLTLAAIMISKEPRFRWLLLLSLSLIAIFLTHTTTFVICVALTPVIVLAWPKKNSFRSILFLGLAYLTFVTLSAIVLFPQLAWIPTTTRAMLLNDKSVHPQWRSILEFIRIIVAPLWDIKQQPQSIDTEKWIASGTTVSMLAGLGFLTLKQRIGKILLGLLVIGIVTISLNNVSPFYSLLLNQNWYVMGRVTTRIWFPITIIIILLAGKFLAQIQNKPLQVSLALLAIIESLTLSWLFITKPIPAQSPLLSNDAYEVLKSGNGRFRVYCVDHCISQLDAVKRNIELVEGYSTLQQVNYNKHAWELTGSYWNYYSLAIPPFGTAEFTKPSPRVESLAEYNTKYLISPYPINDKGLVLLTKSDSNHFVYQINGVLPRAYYINDKREYLGEANITKFGSNQIVVETISPKSTKLIVAEVFSSGWKAYLNGEEVEIQETPNAVRFVDLKPSTTSVELRYVPRGFTLGAYVSGLTFTIIIGSLLTRMRYYPKLKMAKDTRREKVRR